MVGKKKKHSLRAMTPMNMEELELRKQMVIRKKRVIRSEPSI
jgi:hypothetical protein